MSGFWGLLLKLIRIMAGLGVDREYDQGVNTFTELSVTKILAYEINEERVI